MSVATPPNPDPSPPPAPTPPSDPNPAPSPAPPAPDPRAGTPPAGPGGEGGFTQAQLNAILAEERRKWQGSEEYKAAQAALKRVKELEDSQKSEAEKLTERAAAAEKLASERAGKYRSALIRAAFATHAAAANIPPDRIDDAFRLADLSAVEVDEATDAVKGADKAVKALVEGKAWLVAAPRPVPDINSGGGASVPQDPKAREEELRRRFRLPT